MKKQYIAPKTQEQNIETTGILMTSWGASYIPLNPAPQVP